MFSHGKSVAGGECRTIGLTIVCFLLHCVRLDILNEEADLGEEDLFCLGENIYGKKNH